MDKQIEGFFGQVKDSYIELKQTFDNLQTLEKIFNDGANNSSNRKMNFDDYIQERGGTFKKACHQLTTYLFFLERKKRE